MNIGAWPDFQLLHVLPALSTTLMSYPQQVCSLLSPGSVQMRQRVFGATLAGFYMLLSKE